MITSTQTTGSLEFVSEHTPTYAESVGQLYSWSANFQDFQPFRKFLDLIGYSEEDLGTALGDWKEPASSLGYQELAYLADALTEYANRPNDVVEFIKEVMAVEMNQGL